MLIMCRPVTENFAFVLSDTSRLLRRRFDERARTFGATRAQWKALLWISRNEGIKQGALAELLEVEPITLCRLVDRMEEAGMVERRRDPADRRAWQLFLTEQSHPILARMRTVADDLTAQALEGLSPADVAHATAVMERIRDNLNDTILARDAANG